MFYDCTILTCSNMHAKGTAREMRHYLRLLLILTISLLLAACTIAPVDQTAAIAPSPSPSPTVEPTPEPPTATPEPPTPTPEPPTATPEPTPEPIETPVTPEDLADEVSDTPELSEDAAPPTLEESPPPLVEAPPTPNPADLLPVRLVIPAINLDMRPIPVGLDAQRVPIVPKHDVGWYEYSARPGQGDNIVLWGHVSRWLDSPNIPAPFGRMQELQLGAEIFVYTANGAEHRYVVTEAVQVRPTQVEYIMPTGKEQLTMVSCIGDRVILDGVRTREFRLIVIAEPA